MVYNGTTYYYVLNLQGDVIRLVDSSGTTVQDYLYDAWGAPLNTPTDVGAVNPLRYRGYYYDTETGLYYLQSRYYDPVVKRFINAEVFASTGKNFLGYNMFSYVNNNPINRSDPTGNTDAASVSYGWMAIETFLYAVFGSFTVTPAVIAALAIVGIYTWYKVANSTDSIAYSKPSKSVTRSKAEEKTAEVPGKPTMIYRYGGKNPSNLTPRPKDRGTGLSFSTIPRSNSVCTTIEAVNATGVLMAIQDGPYHVSVIPTDGSIDDWIQDGTKSKWTLALRSIVIKWS